MSKLRYFSPMFCLGVPLNTEEVIHFALLRGEGDHHMLRVRRAPPFSTLQFHPTGFFISLTWRQGEGVRYERAAILTLVSDYQFLGKLDHGEPFTVVVDALGGAFGGCKKLEWWHQHSLNHSQKDHMVRKIFVSPVQDGMIQAFPRVRGGGLFPGERSLRSVPTPPNHGE
jgi:hypothetical protein